MSKRIFITATNTDIGKTHSSCLLINELSAQGHKVGVFKPIETGVEEAPLDGTKLFELAKKFNPALEALTIDDIVPYQFSLPAAPSVARGTTVISYDHLEKKLKQIEEHCDIVLIEGAGGLLVPVDEKVFMVDFIDIFNIDATLLVCPSRLGSINDTLLSRHLLESKHIPYTWAINIYADKESFETVTAPFYAKNYLSLQNDLKAIVNRL